MANFITTPNMLLPNPVPNIDPGPDYADNLQSSLNIVDQHNHTSGSGVQIPPAGLNINAALPMNNNPLTGLSLATFTQQASSSVLNSLFVGTDGNLYFNDGNGDPSIKITAAGLVNATSSGISSGTNTASFVSNVLVVNAATNTPANIQVGSVLLGNNVANSKFLTLSPPAAMGGNTTLTLPAAPMGATAFVTLDTSGNFGTASSISAAQIASGSITGSQIAPSTITNANIQPNTIQAGSIQAGTITTSQINASAGILGSQLASSPVFGGVPSFAGGLAVGAPSVGGTNGTILIAGVASSGTSSGSGWTSTLITTGSYTVTFASFTHGLIGFVPAVNGGSGAVFNSLSAFAGSSVTVNFSANTSFSFIAVGGY